VLEGKIDFSESDWPSFLYDEHRDYDPENPDQGLFRGTFLLWVCCLFSRDTYPDLFPNRCTNTSSHHRLRCSKLRLAGKALNGAMASYTDSSKSPLEHSHMLLSR
jgi:hypothetical protein